MPPTEPAGTPGRGGAEAARAACLMGRLSPGQGEARRPGWLGSALIPPHRAQASGLHLGGGQPACHPISLTIGLENSQKGENSMPPGPLFTA